MTGWKARIIGLIFGGLAYWLAYSATRSGWFALLLVVVIVLLFENQAVLSRRVAALESQLDAEIERNSRREGEQA